MGNYYEYDFPAAEPSSEAINFLLIAYLIAIFISLALSFTMYLLQAIGLYKMGMTLEHKNPWLAFIPLANLYALGKVAETKTDDKKPLRYSRLLIFFNLLACAVSISWLVYIVVLAVKANTDSAYVILYGNVFASMGLLLIYALSITYAIFCYIALYRIYKLFAPENATTYLLLSIFFGNIAQPIIFFCLRNKAPVLGWSEGSYNTPPTGIGAFGYYNNIETGYYMPQAPQAQEESPESDETTATENDEEPKDE